MKSSTFLLSILILATSNNMFAQVEAKNVQHVKVYYEKGMYGGWPANNGIWIWGNEILVGFSKGFHKNLGSKHNIDRDKPQLHLLARSKDGGNTWAIEDPAKSGMVPHGHFVAKPRTDVPQQPVLQLKEPIDFQHTGFALAAYSNSDAGESRYWYSYDKGHGWTGPFALPNFGTPGTAARTDYIVDGKNECTLFITAAKSNGKEGRLLCIKTIDGSGQDIGYPRIVQRPDGKIVVIYYFMDNKTGAERYIGATIWDPPVVGK